MARDEATEEAVAALRDRLLHLPADRYPVEHATTCVHLGEVLLRAGRLAEAAHALRTAESLFAGRHPVSQATALNSLGATLRAQGQAPEAAGCFARAVELFTAHDRELEAAAARFNLGLVRREAGEPAAAVAPLQAARDTFAAHRAGAQLAAAERELAAALLATGEADAAAGLLAGVVEQAAAAGDRPGLAAAANLWGLALLAQDDPTEAAAAFRRSVAAAPRSVDPAGFALAQANLALAHERRGAPAAARLAATQALAVAGAAPAVREQAAAVLDRLPAGSRPRSTDLLEVLDAEPAGTWPVLLREELVRWADLPAPAAAAEAAGWVAGVLGRRAGPDLVAAWVGVLLELPPPALAVLVPAAVAAAQDGGPVRRAGFRDLVARALARHPLPQWQRLAGLFNEAAATRGGPTDWG